jgi:hypothetical protein
MSRTDRTTQTIHLRRDHLALLNGPGIASLRLDSPNCRLRAKWNLACLASAIYGDFAELGVITRLCRAPRHCIR